MDDPELPLLFSAEEAFAVGLTRHQVAHRVTRGGWTVLRRGLYAVSATYDALDPDTQHLVQVAAALRSRGHDVLASHLSAACAYGWPRPLRGWGGPVLTCPELHRPVHRSARLVVQAATVGPQDRALRGDLPLTAPARTVADVLRHRPAKESVPIVDHALRDDATLGEADGRAKYLLRGPYLRGAMPDVEVERVIEAAQRRLDAEKARRDALHDLGLEVVRWGFAELARDPDAVARRVQARRAAADATRFTGRFRRRPAGWTAPATRQRLPLLMGSASEADDEWLGRRSS